jgi:hypothetical protein
MAVMLLKSLTALVMVLAQGPTAINLSGDWKLVSSTLSSASGEVPQNRYVADSRAFNCGRGCRIVHKGSTLTIDNAQLEDAATASSPIVTIELDGQPHTVVDSVNVGSTLEVTGHAENGTVMITTMVAGRPANQTISLEGTQLVVVSGTTVSANKRIFRYTKK